MATDLEKKDAKRKGRNEGLVLGALASLATALIYTKATGGKHITDDVTSTVKKGKDYVSGKIAEHKEKKAAENKE